MWTPNQKERKMKKKQFLKRAFVLVLATTNLLSITPNMVKAETAQNVPYQYIANNKEDKSEKEQEKLEKEQEKENKKQLKEERKLEKERLKQERHLKKEKKVKKEDYTEEWNIAAIHADKTDDIASSQRAIKVAIIDSGIDYTEDIDVYMRKNFIPGEDEVSIIYEDSCGHGTSIAGIIAAKDNEIGITGINPSVQLYSARVLDYNKQAPIDRVVEAINWAIAQDVDIINLSFGTSVDSPALHEAIQTADNAGILLIAAAGNKNTVEYPAAYEEVIAVGSVDEQGERCEDSAIGENLELVAPGRKIVSTGDFGGLSVAGGTSLAAAHVTGIASLLWQKNIDMPADFIRELLCFSANKYGTSMEYGHGLIDYSFALEQYDAFKEIYNTEKANIILHAVQDDTLQLNDSEILAFENIDYVEGSWGPKTHQELANASRSGSGAQLSTQGRKILKAGAVAPDNFFPNMSYYPELHGYTARQPGGNHEYYSNYVFAYLYLTEIAVGIKKKYDPRKAPHTFTASCVSDYCNQKHTEGWCIEQMKNQINSLFTDNGLDQGKGPNTESGPESWDSIMKNLQVENNEQNRSIFVYGFALHTITDLFAHSSCDENGKTITHDNGADNRNILPNRYECAKLISQYLIEHIKRAEKGSLNDFLQVAYNKDETSQGTAYAKPVFDGKFRLARLSKYINAIDPVFYQNYYNIFDAMSCR